MRDGRESDLSHVFWIGGSACAGKSTIARGLSEAFGLPVHEMDKHGSSFWTRVNESPGQYPKLVKHKQHWDECKEVFMPANDWARFMYELTTEGWPLIRGDLTATGSHGIICEGAYLNPGILTRSVAANRVVFLIAHESFQRKHFLSRENLKQWIDSYRDPDDAFEKLMTALGIVARKLHQEARDWGTKVITVDETTNVEEVRAEVVLHFEV